MRSENTKSMKIRNNNSRSRPGESAESSAFFEEQEKSGCGRPVNKGSLNKHPKKLRVESAESSAFYEEQEKSGCAKNKGSLNKHPKKLKIFDKKFANTDMDHSNKSLFSKKNKKDIKKSERENSKKTIRRSQREERTDQKTGKCDEENSLKAKKSRTKQANSKLAEEKSQKNLSSKTPKAPNLFGRTVKKFVSRPPKEEDVKKFMTTVARSKSTTNAPRRPMRMGEDVFVSRRNRRAMQPTPIVVPTEVKNDYYKDLVVEDAIEGDGLLPINTNHNNNGAILVKGRPFWLIPSVTPEDEDLKGIEETKEMNAQVIIDVSEGKLSLKSVPTMPIAIDPFAEIEVLRTRDKNFFDLDLIFSNTIRSMINTTNGTQNQELEKSGASEMNPNSVKLVEPTAVRIFDPLTRKFTREEKLDPNRERKQIG